jgi:hypothetical protein
MTNIRVEANVTTEQLLHAVQQLPHDELDTFVAQVLAVRAQQAAPHLTQTESELLLRINQPLPAALQEHYNDLVGKRRAEQLTPTEHTELLALTDQIEQAEADRAAALAALAQIRQISVRAIMQELGLQVTYA